MVRYPRTRRTHYRSRPRLWLESLESRLALTATAVPFTETGFTYGNAAQVQQPTGESLSSLRIVSPTLGFGLDGSRRLVRFNPSTGQGATFGVGNEEFVAFDTGAFVVGGRYVVATTTEGRLWLLYGLDRGDGRSFQAASTRRGFVRNVDTVTVDREIGLNSAQVHVTSRTGELTVVHVGVETEGVVERVSFNVWGDVPMVMSATSFLFPDPAGGRRFRLPLEPAVPVPPPFLPPPQLQTTERPPQDSDNEKPSTRKENLALIGGMLRTSPLLPGERSDLTRPRITGSSPFFDSLSFAGPGDGSALLNSFPASGGHATIDAPMDAAIEPLATSTEDQGKLLEYVFRVPEMLDRMTAPPPLPVMTSVVAEVTEEVEDVALIAEPEVVLSAKDTAITTQEPWSSRWSWLLLGSALLSSVAARRSSLRAGNGVVGWNHHPHEPALPTQKRDRRRHPDGQVE